MSDKIVEIVGFEHLHLHSDYSLLDGLGQVEEYGNRAVEINQKFLTVSDHGMLGAVPRQIKICDKICDKHKDKNKLSPIFASELYINSLQPESSGLDFMQSFMKDLDEEQTDTLKASPHLLAIAYTNEGYKNLVRLTSWGWTKGFYRKPRVNYETLMKHKEGLIFTSCCYNSEIGRAFDKGGEEAGFQMLEKHLEMFGKDHFYLELMLLDFKKQFAYDAFIVKCHEKYKIPLIVSCDVHYCNKEDSHYQRLMLMIQTNRTLKQIEEAKQKDAMADFFELQDENLWMKSEEELNEKWLKDYSEIIPYELFQEAKKNTVRICEKAKGVTFDRSLKLPAIEDGDEKLKELTIKGFNDRNLPKTKVYLDRLKEEISLIKRKGFSSYFLIQKMMTDEARRICPQLLGWGDGSEAVGPGRGCLEGSTLVVTEDGLSKPISDIKIGDRVCTSDGTFQNVINVFEYPLIDEELLTIRSYYGDNRGVSLTRDHKVLVEKFSRVNNYENWAESTKNSRKTIVEPTGNLKWIPAEEVSVGDWVFVPSCKFEEKFEQKIDLSKFCDDQSLYEVDGYVFQNIINNLTKTIKKKKCKRFISDLKSFWTIAGIFTGDGWLRTNNRANVGFAFHEDNNSFGIELLENFCLDMDLEYSVFKHKTKKLKQFYVNNRYFQLLFKDLFCDYTFSSKTKHVPKDVFNLPDDLKWAFLTGYLSSDGHVGKNKISFDTISPSLASQIRVLLLSLGVPSSMNYSHRFDKRTSKSSYCYKLNVPMVKELGVRNSEVKYFYRKIDGGALLKVRKIDTLNSVKKVYDIQVENNSNYLTSSFLVHNSACGSLLCYCLGITDVDPIKEDLLFSRFLSESRGGRSMVLEFKDIDPI
jgi:DNA polymerase-3 subunit alpha